MQNSRSAQSKVNGNDHTSWDPDRDPLEELAAEYAQRYRDGHPVSVEDYARRYPDYAEQIRELLPAVTAIEQLNSKRAREVSTNFKLPALEQLGDYRVVGEIARGGMGVVYEAEQVSLGRRVAVKVLPPRALRSQRDVRRFEREAKTAAKLHHTNIVPVFGVGEDEGNHYIVMQLIQGVGLDEILGQLKRMVGDDRVDSSATLSGSARSHSIRRCALGLLDDTARDSTPAVTEPSGKLVLFASSLTAPERSTPDGYDGGPRIGRIRARVGHEYYRNVARLGLQAAHALSYAHRHGTLHRDIKPGNLLLDESGVLWMADFGLAKAIEQDDVTGSGDLVGTLGYMAPERFEGVTTAQSDIYSLGLTLYELLTFDRAYDGKDRISVMHQIANRELPQPRRRNPDVPRDLETIVMKAAARRPADRYESVDEMATDLDCFLNDRPIQARRMGQVEILARWCRRNRAIASLAASVVLLLGAIVAMTTAGYMNATGQKLRAEATSVLAISALDEIYGQFAPTSLSAPSTASLDQDEADALLGSAQLPISKDVAILLQNLLRFYDELSKQSDNRQSVAIKSIAANRRVGDIRRRLGELEEARKTYVQAAERVAALEPHLKHALHVRLEFARIHNGLGIVSHESQAPEEAIQAHQRAIDELDGTSDSPDERLELARSLYLLHLALQRAQAATNAQDLCDDVHIRRAIEILRGLGADRPQDANIRFLFARCLLARSVCNSDGTLSSHQTQAVAMLESLVENSPEVAEYRYELGDAYRSIEWRESRRYRGSQRPVEELVGAEDRLRRGLQVTSDLGTSHPNIPKYTVLSKTLHHLLANVLRDQDRLDEAESELQRVIDKQRIVVRQAREPAEQQVWLSHAQLRRAQILRDLGRYSEARRDLEETVAELERLATAFPQTKDRLNARRWARRFLARSYATLACVLSKLGEHEQADAVLRKAECMDS